MTNQKVYKNITDTMSMGLTPDMTGYEFKNYSKIYLSAKKVKGIHTNSIPCKDVTDRTKFVICDNGACKFELKRICRKDGDNYVLKSINDGFSLKNYSTSGYEDNKCMVYRLVTNTPICTYCPDLNIQGMTPNEIIKKAGFTPSKYTIKHIDFTAEDEYFKIEQIFNK